MHLDLSLNDLEKEIRLQILELVLRKKSIIDIVLDLRSSSMEKDLFDRVKQIFELWNYKRFSTCRIGILQMYAPDYQVSNIN